MMTGAPLVITAAGALGMIAAAVAVAVRQRKLNDTATRLVELALGGRADEARIQARNESSELAPVLEALGGELAAPKTKLPLITWIVLAVIPLPTLALALYARQLVGAVDASSLALVSSVLQGVAILAPVSITVAYTVVAVARAGQRSIRGACVTLLAKNVKAAVDAEVAEALRRGTNLRDPRGE
ncbi:hypothetical protein L6R52_37000 [Myxococcota bacterium]|nr:hypothetical protein [Myxococcota bacterium]